MRLHRIRKIVNYSDGSFCLGLSLPNSLSDKWLNTYVTIIDDGTQIILQSGALPSAMTKKDIKADIKVLEKIRL